MNDLALFDFDGTITSKDTFTAFIHEAVKPSRLLLGKILLSPLIVGYKLGIVRGSTIRTGVSRFGFFGRSEKEIRAAGASFSTKVLPAVVRPEMLERIRWHKDRGDTVVVVSASLDVYLSDWCKALGIDLICTELKFSGGRTYGRYKQGDCSGPRKACQIRTRFDVFEYREIFAYGDTKDDLEMLEMAQHKFYRGRQVSQAEIERGLDHHANQA
ncbi:HAD family hydrolase [Xanthomonas sp. 3075]|uniref:HAD family hydrolase n=1 Tax=Xanthomonas sp. 3075 TaxID=3035315 RepID=UPI00161E33D8|nr:HAD family hydrolase [Xanthomonas sp. 3075]MBB4133362.1 HAD superfamily hydrolase (TIGR01490 family) [Xanthomonas sp. 3075]